MKPRRCCAGGSYTFVQRACAATLEDPALFTKGVRSNARGFYTFYKRCAQQETFREPPQTKDELEDELGQRNDSDGKGPCFLEARLWNAALRRRLECVGRPRPNERAERPLARTPEWVTPRMRGCGVVIRSQNSGARGACRFARGAAMIIGS